MSQHNIEQWRPVVGYEGYYEVSSHGQVRSVARIVAVPGGPSRRLKGRVLRHTVSVRQPHRWVMLSRDGQSKNMAICRLVARAYLPPPRPNEVVQRRDGDRLNDHLSNLYYGRRRGGARS